MTAEEFVRSDANRTEIENLLKNPTLLQAFDVLMGEISPSVDSVAKLNPVLAAALYQQVAGANHIVKGLRKLTLPYREKVVPRGKRHATEADLPKREE
jgi:hypothetical protein